MSINLAKVIYVGKEAGSGRKMRVVGSGLDLAAATAEANTKMAITVMVVDHVEQVQPFAGTAATPATGQFTDAVFVLQKTGEPDRVVRLDNVTTAIFDGSTGRVPVGTDLPASVAAFAAAWTDGNGTGGYTFKEGYAVR